MKKIELLAPAGDLARLKLAVRYGADAVYCGGKVLSLRSAADNLSIEDIREGVEYANKYGAKIYITVNMIPHDEDLAVVKEYLKSLEEAGVTAIIVSSLNLIKIAKDYAPKLQRHLSTQQTTINSQAVKFWESQGVDRVILAREVTLEEIKLIKEKTTVELEVFIHGGMCSNYSGRCLLSNQMTLRDANRGGCAQSCRWHFNLYQDNQKLNDENSYFTMGSKDLKTTSLIPELINSKVCSLKIEGRMKTAYYLASVVKGYRYLIDCFYETGKIGEPDYAYASNIMGKVQNRATCTGFLEGIPGDQAQLFAKDKEAVVQDYLGDVVDFDLATLEATIRMRNHVEVGQKAVVIGADYTSKEFMIESMIDQDGNRISVANRPMQLLRIRIGYQVYPGDFLRRV